MRGTARTYRLLRRGASARRPRLARPGAAGRGRRPRRAREPHDHADEGEARREAREDDPRRHRIRRAPRPGEGGRRLPRARPHAEDDRQPARRVALLRLRRRPVPRGRRCDARAAAAAPGELGADRNRRVVVVFDEFQEVVDLDPNLPKLMRSVFQEQPEVAHVYLGSKRYMMERIFNDEHEPFWRSASSSSSESSRQTCFARSSPRGSGRAARTSTRVHSTGSSSSRRGHPYATQELCYFTWGATAAGERADVETVEAGLAGVLRSEHAHFTLLLAERVGGPARSPRGARGGARTALQRGLPSPLQPPVGHECPEGARRARETGARGQATDGRFAITEPFFAQWIERDLDERPPGRPSRRGTSRRPGAGLSTP